eukprot:9149834-Pyramimonas_sp.AAC.1
MRGSSGPSASARGAPGWPAAGPARPSSAPSSLRRPLPLGRPRPFPAGPLAWRRGGWRALA